jgi:Mg2+ and Co2+ transporter CorA
MPELRWHFGYPEALASMLILAAALWGYFRHIDWL